jgi:Silencing defective 2 N-terminal ubiquitin domain
MQLPADATVLDVACALRSRLQTLPPAGFLLLQGGRVARDLDAVCHAGLCPGDDIFMDFRVRDALVGGKGGFGAMLRGTNAGKKTTNYGMSRDLNGRRIRDVEAMKQMHDALQARGRGVGSSADHASVHGSTDAEQLSRCDAEEKGEEGIEAGVDVAALEDEMVAVSGKIVDAVAEGMKAARALRKQQKHDRKMKKRLREAADAAPGDSTASPCLGVENPLMDDADEALQKTKLRKVHASDA